MPTMRSTRRCGCACAGGRLVGVALIAAALIAAIAGVAGAAQENVPPALEQRIELDKLADIDARAAELPTTMLSSRIDFQYGGWLRALGYLFRNSEADRHVALNYDLRLWAQVRFDEIHTLYVRPRISYTRFATGEDFDSDAAFENVRLNLGFYDLDVAKLLDNALEHPPLERLHVTAGRKFFSLGSGLLFARRADGIELRGRQGNVEYLVFGAKTVHSDDDEDRSRPHAGCSVRRFLAAQVKCVRFPSFHPYLLLMRQRDYNDRHPAGTDQAFVYNSDYVGIGFDAVLASRVRTTVEWIKQTGRSASEGSDAGTEGIDAHALVVRAEAPIGGQHRLRAFGQYLFGSGDIDRADPTDTIGGNRPGTPDKSFVPFGFVDTGWALSPTLSNLHVFQLGLAGKPADTLEVGSSFYVFRKEHARAGLSDRGATRDSHNVGQELDVFANWAIFSDLTASAVFGYFWAGSAMDPVRNRPFAQISITYSF